MELARPVCACVELVGDTCATVDVVVRGGRLGRHSDGISSRVSGLGEKDGFHNGIVGLHFSIVSTWTPDSIPGSIKHAWPANHDLLHELSIQSDRAIRSRFVQRKVQPPARQIDRLGPYRGCAKSWLHQRLRLSFRGICRCRTDNDKQPWVREGGSLQNLRRAVSVVVNQPISRWEAAA